MNQFSLYAVLLAGLFLWGCAGEGAADTPAGADPAAPDWVLLAGTVITGDPEAPAAQALAVRDGRITAVGSHADIAALAGDRTRMEKLPAAVVVPGLTDAHGHVLSLGLALERLRLEETRSYDDLIARTREAAAGLPLGTWILGRGWDQSQWPGGAFPVHGELSAAVPDHPVLLSRVDGHAALANAAALAAAGVTAATPDPAGGRILRDAAGAPSGVLVDNAIGLVTAHIPAPDRARRRAAVERALAHLASRGLTGVHDAGMGSGSDVGWEMVDLYRELLAEGRLSLRIYGMLGGNGVRQDPAAYFGRPPVMGEGDGLLTVRAVKVGMDGALGSRGAALESDYADEAGHRGLLTREPGEVHALVQEAFASGWQIAVHAIGDRGNRLVLDAVAAARTAVPDAADPRPRLEHSQVLRLEDLDRFRELGVIASVQPTHATTDRRFALARLGPKRLAGAYAYASLAAAGAVLACGSDFPVEAPDPLAGLQAAVSRTDAHGLPPGGWRMEEALSARQALACFTSGAARARFAENELGRIAPGFLADLTLLDGNPLAHPGSELASLGVLRTVVGGRTVWDGSGPATP